MPMQANGPATIGIRPTERPQQTERGSNATRTNGTSAVTGFSPRTDVAIKNAVSNMASILAKISTNGQESVEEMPPELRQVIDNVLKQAFSYSETLGKGLGSAIESQRFSMDQLESLARMLFQMSSLAEKGQQAAVPEALATILQSLKSMVTDAAGKDLEPVILAKLAFALIDEAPGGEIPKEVQQLLAALAAPTAAVAGQQGTSSDMFGFLKKLVDFFMPRPAATEGEAESGGRQGARTGQGAETASAGRQPGAATAQTAQGARGAAQSGTANAAQQGAQAQSGAQAGQAAPGQTGQAGQAAQGQAMPGQTGQATAQGQAGQAGQVAQGQAAQGQAAQGQAAQGQATQGQATQGQAGQATQGAQTQGGQAAQQGARAATPQGQPAQQGAQTQSGQGAQGQAQTAGQAGETAPRSGMTQTAQQAAQPGQAQNAQNARARSAMPQAAQAQAQAQSGTAPQGQGITAAMQQARNALMNETMQNTPQMMNALKDLSRLILKDQQISPRETALLTNFVNGTAKGLSEQDAKSLQLLIRLCQQNVPATVQQAAIRQNMPDLPRLWAFMQLCDMTATRKMTSDQLKKSGKDVALLIHSMRGSMGGDNAIMPGSRSMNFMLPLFFFGVDQYPAYIHVFDENKEDKATGVMRKETWLRICMLTDSIGAVELTSRVFNGDQLDMRLFFSNKDAADEFREELQAVRKSLRGGRLKLHDFEVNATGERRFL